MQNLHLKLTSKYPRYNSWHQTKHHNKIHWGVLVVFTLLIFGTISLWTPISFAADIATPTTPTNLITTAISSTQINLSWTASTDNVGVTGYKIYRCAGSACAPTVQIATSATNSYSDTGLTASTAYTYTVSAYDAAGNESGKSGTASATTQASTGSTLPAWLDPNSPLALNLHPRLLFIPQSYRDANPNAFGITVQEMRNKLISHAEYITEFQTFISTMDSIYSVAPSSKTKMEATYDTVSFSFLYKIDPAVMSAPPYNFSFQHTKDEYGNKALEHAEYIANQAKSITSFTYNSWNEYVTDTDGGGYSGAITSVSLAIVNDWLNDRITQSIQKLIMDAFINIHSLRPQLYLFASAKHFGTAQNGAGVIGIYGDDLGSQYYKDQMNILMDDVGNDWIKSFKEMSDLLFGGGSNNPEGPAYDDHAFDNMLPFVNIFATSINESLFNTVSYLREHVFYNLFRIIPMKFDGKYTYIETDDSGGGAYVTMDWGKHNIYFSSMINGLSAEKASLARWVKETFHTIEDSPNVRYYSVFYRFFQGYKHVLPESPSMIGLKTSKNIGMGQYMMRTGFEDQSDSLVAFFAPKYHTHIGHAHRDFASFRIFKYGNLAITRQIAKGFSGGNIMITQNNMFYNTIGVLKPGEMTNVYNIMGYRNGYDGGNARYVTDPAFMENGASHVGTVLAEDLESVNYDYVNYDYSNSWDKTKVNYAQREFVYLRPQGGINDEYVVVFDRVNSVDPNYKKYFILHSSFDPEVDGTLVQERPGKWVSTDTSIIKISNAWNGSHGRLFSKTLLPASYQVNKIGGPGYYWQDAEGQVIYGGTLTDKEKNYRGSYSLYTEAMTNQSYDNFLHVIQFGDSNTLNQMPPTTTVDTVNMVGALINDPVKPRIVLFSKDPRGAKVSSVAYNANYSPTLTGEHLLVDLSPGTYDVYKNGAKILTGITSETGKNTLSFESIGGSVFQIVKTVSGAYYISPFGLDTNSGSILQPFKTIAKGLSLAKAGDTVYLRQGTYSELLSFPTPGDQANRITLKAYNKEKVIITQTGRVLNLAQPYITIEDITIDANWGNDDAVKIFTSGNYTILRGVEVKNTRRDAIDMGSPQGVLIENSKIHDAIWVDGIVHNDAHGIVTAGVKDFTVRNTEIYYVSGDAVQLQYGGWNNVLIENSTLWNGPLPTARGGAPAGVYPGENAVDTKYYLADGRGKLTIKNVTAYGWKSDYLVNAAAFNLKHNIDAILDGITTYDNDIDFRLRGPNITNGSAWVTIKNAVIHDTNRAIRYEDKIENLHIYNSTFGNNITKPFENAGGFGAGFEAKNNLFLAAAKPAEAGDVSNLAATFSSFTNSSLNDYHLVSTSPAINKGITILEVTRDRDGVSRPQELGYDIGAYEYIVSSDTQAPSPPTNLKAFAISSTQINLSWTASTDDVGVTGYKIYRNSQFVNSLNSLMYNDIDLTASTAYTYTVSAFDAAGNESAQSQSISATTLPSFKPSDLNQDEVVNQLDFDILKQDFSRTDKPKSDLNQDGIVDSRDLGILMSEWTK